MIASALVTTSFEVAEASSGTVGTDDCIQTVGNTNTVSVSEVAGFCVITFRSGTVTWTVPSNVSRVDYLLVGGGGGGAARNGGGGGGGGVVSASAVAVSSLATVTVTVGAGGTGGQGAAGTLRLGTAGLASSIAIGGNTFSAQGGSAPDSNVVNGGTSGNSRLGGSGSNAGCLGGRSTDWCAGGGGGAGSAGSAASPGNPGRGGNGGNGLASNITGAEVFYGGGGGGGSDEAVVAGSGGSGGGGNGSDGPQTASSGVANTGGGGGGGGYCQRTTSNTCQLNASTDDGSGGNGGSGVVIVRYAIAFTISFNGNGNTSGSIPANQTKSKAVDLTVATNSGSLARTGFTFNGWNTAADGSGTSYATGSTYSPNTGATLFAQWALPSCSPSTSTASPGFTIITFTSVTTCSWTVPSGVTSYEVAVIGGGGGGGFGSLGGGGGAGEVLVTTEAITASPGQQIAVTVGQGGTSGAPLTATTTSANWTAGAGRLGGTGGLSAFGNVSARGGGGGGGDSGNATSGGSGGGGTVGNSPGAAVTSTYSGWVSYANAGTAGLSGRSGGGGGGAGGAAIGGAGGAGRLVFGRAVAAGGGGWGGTASGGRPDNGRGGEVSGVRIGGDARLATGNWPYAGSDPNWTSPGNAGTGSGGGSGAPGGSGLVIVRFANAFPITYNGNGSTGGSVPSAQTKSNAVDLTLATNSGSLTRAGYTFIGWNTAATGSGTAYAAGSTYSANASATLFARWVEVSPPTNVQVTPGNQSVTVEWSEPSTAASESPTAYRVEYSTTGTGTWLTASSTISSSARNFQITGLTNGTQYYVRVAAVYTGVTGAYGYPWTLIFESTTSSRVSEQIVYTSTNGLTGNDIDLTRTDFSRVRYYVGAKYTSGAAARFYVDANFDKSVTSTASGSSTYSSLIRLQVPLRTGGSQSQFQIHGTVGDLDVLSNVQEVTLGIGLTGRLEIWPWDYGRGVASGLVGGSLNGSTYDDGDSYSVGNGLYGSFQLHNLGNSPHTIFAWNRHADSSPEIGFGNNTLFRSAANVAHPDWTFARDSGSYTQRTDFLFQSYANLSVTPVGNYSLTFDGNGNTGGSVPANQTKTHSVDLTVATNSGSLVRAGYTFTGWNTSANGSGTSYASGSTYSVNTSATLFAQWSTNSLTVTYDTQGGSAVSSTTTNTGGNVSNPGTPTRAGYSFTGWFTAASAGSALSFPYTHSQTANFTLFAQWSAVQNTVTFKSNYTGGPSDVNQSISSGVSTALTTNSFTRTGYTFAGWNTLANGTGANYTNGQSVTLLAGLTLFARWTANTLTVTFDTQGGSSVSSSTTVTAGTLSAPVSPTRAGYTFAGWFAAGSGGSALSFPYTHGQTSNFTIFAQWTANTYTIIYQYNGATAGSSSADATYTSGTSGITLPSPTRTGYTFAGWYDNNLFSGSAATSPYTTTQNRTLYAKWTAINYTVSYSSAIVVDGSTVSATAGSAPVNGATYNIGQNLVVAANTGLLSRTGYTFGGWVTNSDGSGFAYSASQTITFGAANIVLYPKWIPATYTITYHKNGASGELAKATDTYTTLGSALTLPGGGTMTKAGYTFGGWSTTANDPAISNANYTTTQNVTLYAVWTLANFTITYNLNTGDGSAPGTQTANFETDVTIASIGAANKTGHWFAGWNTQADRSGNSYGAGQVLRMPIGGLTLYAVWVPDVYKISYNANGGTGGPNLSATGGFDDATFGVSYQIRAKNNIARSGYRFAYWTTTADGTGTRFEEGGDNSTLFTSFSPSVNTIFYAQWTANNYTFTFNPDGGNNSPVNQSKTIGQIVTLPSPGTKTGYTFNGWSDGTNIYPVASAYVVGAASVNFQAVWTANVYSVIFDWQGGIGTGTTSASYTVGTGNLTLPSVGDVVKDGFTFAGWSTTAEGTVTSTIQPTGNSVVYAIWNSGNFTLTYEAAGGTGIASSAAVPRGNQATLPNPTRDGFVLEGWYTSASGGDKVGNAGDNYNPGRSKSLHARWVQRSLHGVDRATLETANSFVASSTTGIDTTLNHVPTSTSARVVIPAGALPNGTAVNVQYFRDTDRQSSLIPGNNSYFFAVLVSWLLGTDSSATVPNTAAGKPILVTLTNSSIKAGAMVYMVIGTQVTEMGRATVDGTVTVELTQDPELVVAATAPSNPISVSATVGDQSATVSWTAPTTNGGSEITNYTVTATGGAGSCTTTATSCLIEGLTNGQEYSFTVIANNAVGSSGVVRTLSVSPTASPYTVTFNPNGGSTVASGTFTAGSSISEPSAPTRSGYTFNGWSTTLDSVSAKVTFPYTPSVSANLTLFALWTEVVTSSGGGGGTSGSGGSGSSSGSGGGTTSGSGGGTTGGSTGGGNTGGSSQTTSPGASTGSGTVGSGDGGGSQPGSSTSSSQIGFIPSEPTKPVHESGPTGEMVGSTQSATFIRGTQGEKLDATIGGVRVTIAAENQVNRTEVVSQKLEFVLNVGATAAINGTGLLPNTFVEVWVFSDPMFLGSIRVNSQGAFDSSFKLPGNLLPGLHTLQIGTLDASGKLVKLSIPLVVKGAVSVGTFKGFVAIYTTNLEGQDLSAKVAGRWIKQNPITTFKNFKYSRLVRFTGGGYNIIIDVYVNKVFYKRFTTRTR